MKWFHLAHGIGLLGWRGLGGLSFQHFLHDLVLLNQEGTHNPVANARRAAGAAIRPRYTLLALANTRILARAQSRDLHQRDGVA